VTLSQHTERECVRDEAVSLRGGRKFASRQPNVAEAFTTRLSQHSPKADRSPMPTAVGAVRLWQASANEYESRVGYWLVLQVANYGVFRKTSAVLASFANGAAGGLRSLVLKLPPAWVACAARRATATGTYFICRTFLGTVSLRMHCAGFAASCEGE
jgi:hypothetical protein